MRHSRISLYVRSLTTCALCLSLSGCAYGAADGETAPATAQTKGETVIYDFEVLTAAGETVSLAAYRGQVMLIVNTASKCGFTKQYAGLQELHQEYAEKGLAVLAFPCNQFGGQEPKDDAGIQTFCSVNYGVTFPVFAKLKVNGDEAHPLFTYLKSASPGADSGKPIRWNFTKFLVDREGAVAGRYGSRVKPSDLAETIERLLGDD